MGAESTTPPAPADDKSQNPGGIFHSLKKKKKNSMIYVAVFNGFLPISQLKSFSIVLVGCFLSTYLIPIIKGPFLSASSCNLVDYVKKKRWMVIHFVVLVLYFPDFGCAQVKMI